MLFQFHKGTIRTQLEFPTPEFDAMFQFHKGTIRTGQTPQVASAPAEFQFHKGTIRTTDHTDGNRTYRSFNSIKVRLERISTMFQQ